MTDKDIIIDAARRFMDERVDILSGTKEDE
ncbi:hypothetical protein LCGC14_1494070 [marine sediment metagenome]|uniref:Uncharacterized protein n=1 Tax=marine sediment metagenome TaxID=412755 RepID=A0A0F9J5Y7_9ZZZZ